MAKKQTKKRKQDTFPVYLRVHGAKLIIAVLAVCFCIVALFLVIRSLMFPSPKPVQTSIKEYDVSNFVRPREIPTATPSALSQDPVKIPVIMYHYVEYVKDPKDIVRRKLSTGPREFEGQLLALKAAGYDTFFVKDIPDILAGQVDYSTRSAVLTFDDGYEDFYTNVFPLLKKHHARATLYIIYDFIGRRDFLTRAQIGELVDSGLVEIGSHTLTHRYLKTASTADIRREVFDSKKKLEDDFRITVRTFAYPNGAMNAQAVQAVRDAGYTAAVSVIPGTFQSEDNLFLLSRVRPGNFTPATMIQVLERMKK